LAPETGLGRRNRPLITAAGAVVTALAGTAVADHAVLGGYWKAGLLVWVLRIMLAAAALTVAEREPALRVVVKVCVAWLIFIAILSLPGVTVFYIVSIALLTAAAVQAR
jgi:hypothetical protein